MARLVAADRSGPRALPSKMRGRNAPLPHHEFIRRRLGQAIAYGDDATATRLARLLDTLLNGTKRVVVP